MYDSWLFENTRIAGALALLLSAILLALSDVSLGIVSAVVVVLLALLWHRRLERPYDAIAIVTFAAGGAGLVLFLYGRGEVPVLPIVVGALFALGLSQVVLPAEFTEA